MLYFVIADRPVDHDHHGAGQFEASAEEEEVKAIATHDDLEELDCS